MRNAAATRARILTAATAEFAQHGIAGARVDRIAATATTNKAQLYSYFGNKNELFDAVFTAHVTTAVDSVPLTADDLPGYAVRLYDAYLNDPALVRLVTWARLERTPTGNLFAGLARYDVANRQQLAEAQAAGILVADLTPEDLWALLISLAGTWAQASIVYAADLQDSEADHDRRRRALAATTRRAFCTDSPTG
jgi:AcrR family transcriptional regulator